MHGSSEERALLVDVTEPAAIMAVRSWWDAERVAECLSRAGAPIGVPGVHQRRRRGTLLAARVGGRWRYPPFQVQPGGAGQGFDALVTLLWPVGPGPMAEWLTASNAALGGRAPEAVLGVDGITQELWHAATELAESWDRSVGVVDLRANRTG